MRFFAKRYQVFKFRPIYYHLEPFCKFLKYSKELDYDEKPDYKRFKMDFKMLMMETFPHAEPFLYDW